MLEACIDPMNPESGKPVPLQHTATGGGWGSYVPIRGAISLVEVWAADVVN